MTRRGNVIFIVFSCILLFLIFWQPKAGWSFREFLLGNTIQRSRNPNGILLENDALRAELAKLQDIKNKIEVWSPEYFAVPVYVGRYPFNLRSELTLAAGRNEGLRANQPVFLNKVFIGLIKDVFEDKATVKTIFDASWKSAVRIGASGIEGLLVGGNQPTVTLIDKQADVKEGDIVYAAFPGTPYGAAIGEIKSARLSQNQLFQEAEIDFSYQINEVRAVLIPKP
ncbi:MAG: rod shape-determining protein MreC [Patescibacteria group bacterium]